MQIAPAIGSGGLRFWHKLITGADANAAIICRTQNLLCSSNQKMSLVLLPLA
jgi:hypothetical protein